MKDKKSQEPTHKDGFPIRWFGGNPNETVCGAGSMVENMGPVIKWLPGIVQDKAVCELGCGDLNFARNAVIPYCESYYGYDIQQRKSWEDFEFQLNTILHEANILELGQLTYDIIIVRDVFIHLTNEQIHSTLEKLDCQLLISTTYVGAKNNKRLSSPSAGHQELDLSASPFNLKQELLIQEHASNKFLGVFTR